MPVKFNQLMHLDSIGLIKFTTNTEYIYSIDALRIFYNSDDIILRPKYFGREVIVPMEKKSNKGDFFKGNVSFTEAGRELAPISGASPNDKYFEEVINHWAVKGYTPSTPVDAKT